MSSPRDQLLALAAHLLDDPRIEPSTMMGYPCLRNQGRFFASVNRDGSALIVKLSAERVIEAVAYGEGEPFSPNGRVFREWLAVPRAQSDTWSAMMDEALAFSEDP
jgi:hypothetical protein